MNSKWNRVLGLNQLYFGAIVLAVWLSLASCKTMQIPSSEDLIISMERTACPEDCPVYVLKVYNNGVAVLEGRENIDQIGTFITQITKSEVDNFKNLFNEYGFFDFKEKYYSNASNLPTTYTYFSDQGKSKRITNHDSAPEELKYLELRVSQLLGRSWRRYPSASVK